MRAMSKLLQRTLTAAVMLLVCAASALGSKVRFETVLGSFEVELLDEEAPITVENFLSYVDDGAYTNTIIHRRANAVTSGVDVVQGGGFTFGLLGNTISNVPTDAPIINEFDSDRPNNRGTLAMARTNDLNSATSQWFVNLVDNNLPDFAVFGEVVDGMDVVDAIGGLTTFNASMINGAFGDLPLRNSGENALQGNLGPDLVTVTSITRLPDDTVGEGGSAAIVENPEPGAFVLAAMALAGFLLYCRTRQTNASRSCST